MATNLSLCCLLVCDAMSRVENNIVGDCWVDLKGSSSKMHYNIDFDVGEQ